ncbi:MAG: arsenic efflux protein [Oscillospiraceae bacterium]|nr:arsenic efflux protein [Oscillospiraceae bacterium]
MLDALLDALIDSLKILPFLFLTYLGLEYLESHTEDRIHEIVKRAGWMGPLWGSLLGAVPQCGFSTAASNLYAGRTITLGTLIAIFLSTSDEMLPVMLSAAAPVNSVVRIILLKIIIAVFCGFLIDAILHLLRSRKTGQPEDGEGFQIDRLCEKEHCHCESGSIVVSALKHTGNIILFVFLITLVLNLLFLYLGEEAITGVISRHPLPGLLLSALIGLIPNCGASVLLTQMYLHGVLPASHLIAGLLDGAGVGLLVLFRVNPDLRENLKITFLLYILAVCFGLLLHFIGISF